MAIHQENCDVCNQLAHCDDGSHPRFIANLRVTTVVMGPQQKWPGYAVLFLREKKTELTQLGRQDQLALMEDIADVAAAVESVTGAHKLNIESLGNICHHLHWHVFPRQAEEEHPLDPVWIQMPPPGEHLFQADLHDALLERLRTYLTASLEPKKVQ